MAKKARDDLTLEERRRLVDPDFPIARQCAMLGISRSSCCCREAGPSEEGLRVKRLIDEMCTEHPEFGSRRMAAWLRACHSVPIGRDAAHRRVRKMGIEGMCPGPSTSRPQPGAKVCPHLLRGLAIVHPNQVWGTDITCVPIRSSWLCLVAEIGWHSRPVVSWRLSDTMEIGFVLDCCEEALSPGMPEIMSSDQEAHFTSEQHTSLFLEAGSRISMDHRGRAYDNIFIERFRSSIRHEDICLNDCQSPREARAGIRRYMDHHNNERPRSSLEHHTPAQVRHGLWTPGKNDREDVGDDD